MNALTPNVAASEPDASRPPATSPPGRAGAPAAQPSFDLTGLARGTAAKIEALAGDACHSLTHRIDDVRDSLAKAEPGSRYHTDLLGELREWERRQEEARAIEAAARRVRMARLSDAERARIGRLRERSPDASGSVIDALAMIVPVDPLDLAGLVLDAAGAGFRSLSDRADASEEDWGRAENALEAARNDYRRLLGQRAGQNAGAIQRRLEI